MSAASLTFRKSPASWKRSTSKNTKKSKNCSSATDWSRRNHKCWTGDFPSPAQYFCRLLIHLFHLFTRIIPIIIRIARKFSKPISIDTRTGFFEIKNRPSKKWTSKWTNSEKNTFWNKIPPNETKFKEFETKFKSDETE